MARVFISHASADLETAVEIRLWLRDAGHEVFLDRDLGEGIQIGEEWKRRLYRELRAADAVVCVITESYRASEWCSAEVGIADVLGCPLLPVRVAPAVISPLLEGLQYADLVADPERARAELEQRLERIDTAGGTAWPDGRSPYPGLRPFDADMARVFRGRSVETRRLVARLRSLGERAGGGLVVVVGPSGCGKSSLVRAGLVPAIAEEADWEVVRSFTPGTDPVDGLARAIAATANRRGMGWTIPATASRLADDSGLGGIAADLLIAGRRAPRERLLLVVDQGEELLTRSLPAEVARFGRLLTAGLAGPVRAVVTLRSEFLDRLRSIPELATVDIEPFVLGPLDGKMLRTVVQEPAGVAGLHIDGELVDRLVADTASGDALPLLAFSLAELARGKGRGDELTTDAYAALGGVQGALARHADLALAEAASASGLSAEAVVGALTRLATFDESDQPTRRRILSDGQPPDVQAAYQAFVDHRLLVTAAEDGGTWIGVAHEALLRAWPPLAGAIEARRSALRGVRTIETAAAEWQSAGEAPAYLWDEQRLVAVQAALAVDGPLDALAEHPDLDPAAQAFLSASAAQAQEVRRTRRRQRVGAVTVLSVLLAVSVALGAFAFLQAGRERRRVEDARRALVTQDLVARAETARDSDQQLALQLGIAAHATRPDDGNASASLLQTVGRRHPISDAIEGHEHAVSALALSPDGRLLVSGSIDKTARLWDLSDPAHPEMLGGLLRGHTDELSGVAVSPDGITVATAGAAADRTVRLWDVSDRTSARPLGPPLDHGSGVASVAFSPDGDVLASSAANRIWLWDVTNPSDPHLITQLRGHTGFVTSLAFSPDGRHLASGSGDETVRVWDVADPTNGHLVGEPLAGQTGWVNSVAFSPDGRTLASGALAGIRFWDTRDPGHPRLRPDRIGGETEGVAFAREGHIFTASSRALGQRLWDVSDPTMPRPIGSVESALDGLWSPVALLPDGSSLVASSGNGIVVWDVSEPVRPRSTPGSEAAGVDAAEWIESLHFSPDDDVLATVSGDEVHLWDVTDPQSPRALALLPPPAGYPMVVSSVTFIAGEHVLVIVSSPETEEGSSVLTFWDVAAPDDPRQLGKVTGIGLIRAVAPDGDSVATISPTRDGPSYVTDLWDTSDPADPRRIGSRLPSRDNEIIEPVAFTPDGRFLVTIDDDADGFGSLSLWGVAAGDEPRRATNLSLGVAQTSIGPVALSPDGRTLAAAAGPFADPRIYLWDLGGTTAPRLVGVPLVGEPEHALDALTFSPDSRTLVAGFTFEDSEAEQATGVVWMWDVDDPAAARQLGAPLDTGHSPLLAISPDGRSLAVASGPRATVRFWDTSRLVDLRRDLIGIACEQAGGFSREEWERLVPQLAFPDPCG